MIQLNSTYKLKILWLILIITGCLLFGSLVKPVRAQLFFPYSIYSINPYFTPFPLYRRPLINPFNALAINRFNPIPIPPVPIMSPPYPVLRHAAATTTLLPPVVPPTLLLLSLLFTAPATATTITTGTGVSPNINSNNPAASPVPNLNSVPSVTAPVTPGITSLFLPLLI